MRIIYAAMLVLVCAGLAVGQQSPQDYATRYTGEWAINGTCQRGNTFIFAPSWIERASEDICYIDRVDNREGAVVVKATCWHEETKVGSPSYDLRLSSDGRLSMDGAEEPAKRCGPVPAELLEYYGPAPPR